MSSCYDTHAQTHPCTHINMHAELAKPPLARSGQWQQLSHDHCVEVAFVKERERWGGFSVCGLKMCVCVCVIFVGPLLNPTAQDFCASSHYDEEKHVVPVESRTTSQPGQSVAHNGRFKVLDGVKYKQRKSHIGLKSQELCKVEPLERHCYNFSQPVREQPVRVDFDVTLTNVCTHTHRTHRTSADYYTSSYSKSYFINASFYSIYL